MGNEKPPIEAALAAIRQYLESLTYSGYVITSVHVEAQVKSPSKEIIVSLDHQVES